MGKKCIFLIKLVLLNLLQFQGYKKFFSAHTSALPADANAWLFRGQLHTDAQCHLAGPALFRKNILWVENKSTQHCVP